MEELGVFGMELVFGVIGDTEHANCKAAPCFFFYFFLSLTLYASSMRWI